VRANAPWAPKETPLLLPLQGQQVNPIEGPTPNFDIRAVLTILRRRNRNPGTGEPGNVDFHGTDLRGANLSEMHLEGADLTGAHLEEALLFGAHLDKANLFRTHLEGATLIEAIGLRREYLKQWRSLC
jgi:hypothetical protein